jgi:hypothetical protein
MMNSGDSCIDRFAEECETHGSHVALEHLADYLIERQRFHELFEIRKIQLRRRLRLPVDQWQAIDELPPDVGQQLEQGLLEICRETGERLLQAGEVAEGWQYLEPVGDRSLVARLLRQVAVTDENLEALIHVSVGQGIEPELGFQLVLERFGTCSAITTWESQLAIQPLAVRRGPARLLVSHLYEELRNRVRHAVEDHEGKPAESGTLSGLLAGRPWLFAGLGHHIDTTHLASTVRISRILDDASAISMAIELADYGTRLHEDFQYPGQLPFEQTYCDILEFLQTLSGKSDRAVSRLRQLAESQSSGGNLDAAAWYVYLLDQLGYGQQALQAYLDLVHVQQAECLASEDVCPGLTCLVGKYGCFEMARQGLRRHGDLTGYAAVVAIEQQKAEEDSGAD